MDDSQQTRPAPGAGSTRRERRIAARREQILQAAARVFAEKGFHGATTRDIAEAADVAEGTIYNYFENKDALLLGLIDSIAMLDTRKRQLTAGLDQDIHAFLSEHILSRLGITEAYTDALIAFLPEALARPDLRARYFEQVVAPAMEMLERHLQARIEHGEVRPVDAPLAVRAFAGMFLGMWALAVLGDPKARAAWANPNEPVETLLDLIMDGIRARDTDGLGDTER